MPDKKSSRGSSKGKVSKASKTAINTALSLGMVLSFFRAVIAVWTHGFRAVKPQGV